MLPTLEGYRHPLGPLAVAYPCTILKGLPTVLKRIGHHKLRHAGHQRHVGKPGKILWRPNRNHVFMRILGFYPLHVALPLASRLIPGDTIAVVAPSSAPHKPERLAHGLAELEQTGFRLDWHPTQLSQRAYLAGSDRERAAMLNRAITHPQAKAIMCIRGGYGALRILDQIDYAAARQHPKLLIGFSDATALHLALYTRAGWRGLSGPVVVDFAESKPGMRARFLAMARGMLPPPVRTLRTLRPGTAQGPLLGGNLSMVARLVGTPYLPDLEGAILVLEEVNEAPYRIDALLAQLRLADILCELGGAVLGAFTGWESQHRHSTLTPEEIVEDYFGEAPYPVAMGLRYGHFADRNILPIGTRATLDATQHRSTLSILEPVCQ